MEFNEINILILGAYGGIGQVLTKTLHARGARLFLGGKDEKKLNALAKATKASYQVLDATDFEAVENCVLKAKEVFGELHGIISLVGFWVTGQVMTVDGGLSSIKQ